MPALRRIVYIGLGGAGINSIMKTKKLYVEAYGEVPPMVQFVGMDGNESEINHASLVECGLDYTEIVRLRCYCSKMLPRERYEWMPQEYRHIVLSDFNFPASQIRSLARFALLSSFGYVQHSVQNAIDTSASYSYGTDSRYVPELDGKVQVNLVFSLVGGTGSGIFLDVAYLIRKLYGNRVGLNGYAILPGPYQGGGGSILSNAYASLMELDYLMHLGPQDEPVTFNWFMESFTADDFRATPRPFDWVYLMDNKNFAGEILFDPRDVYDALGHTLFAAGGAVGLQNDAMLDGMRDQAEESGYWAIGIGMTSIVYFKDRVAKVFACKIALKTLERMLDGREEGDRLASEWLDRMGLLKDGRMSRFLDALHPLGRGRTFSIDDIKSPGNVVDRFTEEVSSETQAALERAGDVWSERFAEELEMAVRHLMNSNDRGVSVAVSFLEIVNERIQSLAGEIEAGAKEFESRRSLLQTALGEAVKSLEKEANKSLFLRRRERINQWKSTCEDKAQELMANEIEFLRRTLASKLLSDAVEHASTSMLHLDGLLHERWRIMQDAKSSLEGKLSELERDVIRASFTVIDLAAEDVVHAMIADVAPESDDFVTFVGGKGLEEIESEEALLSFLFAFAESRPEYLRMKGNRVCDVVRAMPVESVDRLINAARQHSSPYVCLKGMSFNPEMKRLRNVIVGVENTHSNPFPPQLLNSSPEPLQCVSTELLDRILFFSQVALFPIRSIERIEGWREDYEFKKERRSPHILVELQERMERQGYDLMIPSK
jgi:hypothetical protein